MGIFFGLKRFVSQYRAQQRDAAIVQNHATGQGYDILAGNRVVFNHGQSYLKQRNEIFYRGIYEFSTPKTTPRIIDCGGNIGLSAIYFKQRYAQAHITVFEADPEVAELCTHNLQAFGYANGVDLQVKAVWTEDTTLIFDARGGASGRIAHDADTVQKKEIKAINFNTYLGQEAEIDMLKIDIEGAETDLLAAIAPQLHKVQNMFVEFHSFKGQPQRLQTLLALISAAGFRYYLESELSLATKPFVAITPLDSFDCMILIFCYRDK